MDDKERENLNRFIHERVIGACWHQRVEEHDYSYSGNTKCGNQNCDVTWNDGLVGDALKNPDYTRDLNLVAEAEKKVVEMFGVKCDPYFHGLAKAMQTDGEFPSPLEIIQASAEQRCLAIREAMKESE